MTNRDPKFQRSKLDMHANVESFSRTLHDCVEQCETSEGLFLMARMVLALVNLLEMMIDAVKVQFAPEVSGAN